MFSLVTACMNRESHLRRTLPSWLGLPGLGEIVVVDWSTREPFDDLLALDPRVKICRAEGESRWMLAYAVNLGVSRASFDHVVKCDADCLPSADIANYVPTDSVFHAGDWRSGRPEGKACVNGQCVFTRSAFERVNGYSELFRVYGRDDEDFYERLAKSGAARREIATADLDFVPHTQEDRVANQAAPAPGDAVDAFLRGQTPFHEMTNLVISQFMPWGPWFPRAVFHPVRTEGRLEVVRRDAAREIPLAPPLLRQAHAHGLVAVTAQLFKLSPAETGRLDPERCRQMILRHIASKTTPPPTFAAAVA